MPIQLRPVCVGFVVDKHALGDVFIRALQTSPVISFHHFSTLTFDMLLLAESQTGEA
jgi:hypothetical protein